MSIYKRKDTWWIQFTAPDGKRIQRSAGTQIKQEAQELYFTRSRIELFQKAESVTLATHQEQTYVLYGCCSGNLQ